MWQPKVCQIFVNKLLFWRLTDDDIEDYFNESFLLSRTLTTREKANL